MSIKLPPDLEKTLTEHMRRLNTFVDPYEIPIPERVHTHVPIRVAESTVARAGHGTFVLENVVAGDVIYSIERPMLTTVRKMPSFHTSLSLEFLADRSWDIGFGRSFRVHV